MKPRVEVRCAECSTPFKILPSRVTHYRYCSKACAKIGGRRKRTAWGLANRSSESYRQAQSERTKKSWSDPEVRARHQAAMQTPEYKADLVQRAKRIVASERWRSAVQAYFASDRAKAAYANRRPPTLPSWRTYIAANGQEYHFRSSWEEALARYLDWLGAPWEFEPCKFALEDGVTYLPDFRVRTPFGTCYVECHRFTHVKPGDEEKVARLQRIASTNLLDYPLILLGEKEMTRIMTAVGMRYPRRKK